MFVWSGVTAFTVATMNPLMTVTDLSRAALGDLVELPDGRSATVRAVMARLSHPVGPMSGFVLAGEIGPQAVLLGLPAVVGGQVLVYAALDRVPAHAMDAVEVTSGVMTYWAPHLPGMSGAMGQLGFKVCAVRGQNEPMVLVWRGRELVVFVLAGVCSPAEVSVQALRRDSATEAPVTRVAAAVTTPDRATPAPQQDAIGLYERFVNVRTIRQ